MIYRCFDNDTLEASLHKMKDGHMRLTLSSDYSESPRKCKLYVDSKKLAGEFEATWRAIKTKMMTRATIYFDEIDWYDDHVNMYETPILKLERGLRKAKVFPHEHGSVPKDWSFNFDCSINATTAISPVMDVLKNVLMGKLDKDFEGRIRKRFRLVLQGKEQFVSVPKILRA